MLADIGVTFFLSFDARQFKELDACSTDGVWPVIGTLSCCNATSNFVQEIRRRDWPVEGSYQVRRECIKCLLCRKICIYAWRDREGLRTLESRRISSSFHTTAGSSNS